MPICVKSEIGPLKRVLLQRPGRELEHLSPNTMGQLLFDDIPYLYGAQREHDCFAQILRDNGAEVVYLEDLTAQVLAGDEELRRRFVEETIRRAGSTAMGYRGDLKRYLLDIQDPLELVLKTMEGVSYQDVFPNEQGRLSSLVHTGARFLMPPIPNLYFTRDPFACIGRGVSLNHMFTDTRNRETLYGDYVLRAGAPVLYAGPVFLDRGRGHPEPEPPGAGSGYLPADPAGGHRAAGIGHLRRRELRDRHGAGL